MKRIKQIAIYPAVLMAALSNAAAAQMSTAKITAPTSSSNTQTVDARQSGVWSIGIDPTKNVVAVQNSADTPLSVSIANTNGRVPFQIRGGFEVFAGGPSSGTEQYLVIPDGKRFVIENITVRAEIPNGESLELSFLSRIDTTPNGNAMYQYIPTSSQGVFVDKNVLMGSHKTLAYSAYRLAIRARPTWSTGTGYADFTFTGYLENLTAQ